MVYRYVQVIVHNHLTLNTQIPPHNTSNIKSPNNMYILVINFLTRRFFFKLLESEYDITKWFEIDY